MGYGRTAKPGVILLVKTIALEFAPWLRTNAVCPGYVLTPMQLAEYTPEMLEEVNRRRYITGQCIVIDGGETTGPM